MTTEWPWLGTKRFWIVAAALIWSAFVALWMMNRRVVHPDALVPVITLSGPTEVMKGERAHYSVLVRDRFGAPIPHATVRVGFWKTSLLELGRGITSDGGDASIEVPFPEDFAEPRDLVAVAEVGVTDGVDYFVVSPRSPGQGRIFVSTDKPLYQPGQTMHVRALAMVGELPLPDKPAVIEIRTGDGVKIFRAEKRTSAFGVVSADFILADQVKLGQYSIAVTATVTPKNDANSEVTVVGNRQVDVKRYSLPKLKIALEDVSSFKADGPLTGTAHATWVFGEPVTKGSITVTLEYAGIARRVVGAPDKDGAFHFELPGRKGEHGGNFTLRAKLDVEGGMHAETSQEVAALGSAIKLEAFPESGALVADVRQTVYVVASHPNKTGITVRQGKDGPEAKTSDRGIAAVSVLPVRPVNANGDLLPPEATIFAFAEDGGEGKLVVSTTDDTLVVRPERASYSAGEPVRVTVLGAKPGEHIAVRMTRGTEPIATGACVVESAAEGCVSTITLPVGASGLAWVHAVSLPITVTDSNGFRPVGSVKRGKRLIIVGGGSRDLDLQITADKKAYAPRDLGSLDVAVTGLGGAPVKAQLGVAVADEAVFLLANVRPDLEKNFFTVDKDLAGARAYGWGQERPLPSSYEASDAYAKDTPPEVKATILAALTTMPEAGGFQNATSSSVTSRASAAVDVQRKKIGGWAVLLLTALALGALTGFSLYGGSRFRRPLFLGADAKTDPTALKLETRGLMVDWLLAVLAPPFLGVMAGGATEIVMDGSSRPEHITATWLVLAPFCAVLLFRAVLRVRRTFAEGEASTLGRVLVFLPLACFIGHLAIVLIIADR
ncbi:MAG: MG2 domain-containing protein, partial [Polyangiaceae bacterium]